MTINRESQKPQAAPQYMFDATTKPSLPHHRVPLLIANDQSLEGYGNLVRHPGECEVEVVQWPAQGWRPVDAGTGDEAGCVEGTFIGEWDGDVLFGRNDAVSEHYVLGWSTDPQQAQARQATVSRDQVLLWHLNYHPDGGQLFFPLDKQPIVFPAALPGDDLALEHVVAFWCDGQQGLYIHPGTWHEGVFPIGDRQRFFDRQGRVHARVSCDIGEEFGVYLDVSLVRPSN